MQPVQCWEKVWTLPENVTGTGSTFKVYKWVKSDKKQVVTAHARYYFVCS